MITHHKKSEVEIQSKAPNHVGGQELSIEFEEESSFVLDGRDIDPKTGRDISDDQEGNIEDVKCSG